jgi:hypothetical protein
MKILPLIFAIFVAQASANQEEVISKLQTLNWKQEPTTYSIADVHL